MKKFKELTEGLGHKVPVYHEPDKLGEYELVGHVHSSATSIGAAKLAKKKTAKLTRVDGKYGWVASDNLRESKYGDAMSSRLPAHLEDPRHEPTVPKKPKVGAPIWDIKYPKPKEGYRPIVKESSWQKYRAAVLIESAELNIPEHTTQEIANKHGFTVQHIEAQLERGIKVEGEHTTHVAPAREIALDHLWENPNYYTVLKKAQLEGCLLEEGLTPREKMSGDERLKPVKPAPIDHAADQKKELKANAYLNKQGNFSYKKFSSDRTKNPQKFIAGLKEGMDEAYDMAFNESGDSLAQFSHHWAQFKLHDNLAHPRPGTIIYGHLPKRNHHEQEMNKHYKNLTTQQKNALRLTESVGSYKVGDKVIAKIGPHKGTVHTVIHVHPTGHLNIKPDVHVRSNRYHLGAAKADPKDVDRAPVNESKGTKGIPGLEHLDLGDEADKSFEKQERARSTVFNNRGKQFKKWPKGMHTTNTGVNRKTIQEIFQAAKDKKDGKPPKVDALPNDGANEPKQEVPGAPGVQPQDAKGPQDGAPGTEKKKDNTPVPENASKSKKMQVKGAGPDDKFQADPQVTPLTHMPDTGNPRNGSAATR